MRTFPNTCRTIASLLLVAAMAVSGCKKDDTKPVIPPATDDQLYNDAVTDAMYAAGNEKVDSLWPIKADNQRLQWKNVNGQQYVLLATFMRYPGSYPVGDSITNSWGESWLFIPGQMKQRLAGAFKPGVDTINRVCQLLGLPPVNSKSNTHIAQIWVKASRLFRPAGNPDITATTAPATLIPTVSAEHTTWFNGYIIFAYYRPLQPSGDYHYPWTRLGYTLDWAPGASKVGLSEYVLQPNSGIWVESVQKAGDFFK
ncbi:hypothetical protein KTO58_09320 [Chitinophaga pendula]|uniref:hypothetical protein n=1 Tax=Chitinophaga TaxID=79328 RepID=UPI000BAFC24E|nr:MULTISPECIES: hypothetical protein [Chitinophaga]ASZ13005.1 hypothetical protein CK934_19590 [Chitinophaga sp. MD30]UCJ09365.1 hypothetical protein KTO58_09320 [Chitinophaga pendula]